MATVINQQNDNQQQQQNQVIQPGAAVGTPAFAGSGASNKTASSGAFTNIQSYLGANKGAGNQIAGQVLQEKDTLQDQASKNQQRAQEVTQKATSEADSFKQGAQAANQILDKSNLLQNYVQNGAPTQQFQQWKSGQTGLQDYQNQGTQALSGLQSAQQGLQTFGQKIGSEQGRNTLIQNLYGDKGNYGPGTSALDQVFLQIGGANKLSQAQKDIASQAAARNAGYENLLKSYNSALGELGTQSLATSQAINAALPQALGGLNTDLTTRASQLQNERANTSNLVKQFFTSGYAGMDDAQRDTVNQILNQGGVAAGQYTYGLDLSGSNLDKYAKFAPTNVSAADIINEQELARQNALATLAGTQAQFSQVGKDSRDQLPVQLMSQQLQDDINAAKQQALNTELMNVAPGTSGIFTGTSPFNKSSLNYGDLLKLQELVPMLREAGFGTSTDYNNLNKPGVMEAVNKTGLFNPVSGSTDPITAALYNLAATNMYTDPITNFLKTQNVVGGSSLNQSPSVGKVFVNPRLGMGK